MNPAQDLEDRLDGALTNVDRSSTRSPAGSRTARGRAATAKALAAGAPKA